MLLLLQVCPLISNLLFELDCLGVKAFYLTALSDERVSAVCCCCCCCSLTLKDEQLRLEAELAKQERNLKILEHKLKSHEDNIHVMRRDLAQGEEELQVTRAVLKKEQFAQKK